MKNLIESCRQLDRKAQRQVFNELSPYLLAICSRYAEGAEDAKDILQESFISIFNNIDKCKAKEAIAFKAWCKRIAVNTALAKRRKKGAQIRLLEQIAKPSHAVSPKVTSRLNAEDIMKHLEKLPLHQRLVFNLVVVDGFTHKEVAKELNIRESNSRTLLTRARQELQRLIEQENTFIKKSVNH